MANENKDIKVYRETILQSQRDYSLWQGNVSLLNLWVRFYPVKQNKFDRVSLTLETSLPSAEQGLYVVTFVEAIE